MYANVVPPPQDNGGIPHPYRGGWGLSGRSKPIYILIFKKNF